MCAKDVHKLVVMVQISGIPTNETKTSFFSGPKHPAELKVKSGFWREFMKEPTVKVGECRNGCQPTFDCWTDENSYSKRTVKLKFLVGCVRMLEDFGMLNVDSSLCCEKVGFGWLFECSTGT